MRDRATILLTPVLAKTQTDRITANLYHELCNTKIEMDSLAEGTLNIRYREGHIQFNHRSNGKVKGITRFMETVYELARRQYLQLHIRLLEQILEEGWTRETERIIARMYPQIEELLKKYED